MAKGIINVAIDADAKDGIRDAAKAVANINGSMAKLIDAFGFACREQLNASPDATDMELVVELRPKVAEVAS